MMTAVAVVVPPLGVLLLQLLASLGEAGEEPRRGLLLARPWPRAAAAAAAAAEIVAADAESAAALAAAAEIAALSAVTD